MIEQAMTKCLSAFFIVVAIYPTAIVPSIVPMVSIMKRDADKPSAHPKCSASPTFSTPLNKPGESISGFDLDAREMEKFKIWDRGTIPYYIDIPSFSDKSLRDRIRWYLNEVNSLTYLNFIELPSPPVNYQEVRWVYFLNRGSYLGCHDISIHNFTTRGIQRVVLGYDCLSRGGGLAEIVLALAGVPPQHNAPNRDEYISVFEDNIIPEKKYLFKKLDNTDWLFHDIDYDQESAGHFTEHKHSVNGWATLRWKGYCTEETPLGQDDGFSKSDILKINMLYLFIVSKSKTDLPTCKKIFDRVVGQPKQRKVQPELLLGPRPKPNKYLGIESVEKDVTGKESLIKSDIDVSENNEGDDGKESDNNTNDEVKFTKHSEESQNSADQSNSEDDPSEKPNERNQSPQKTTRKPLNSYKDPLTYLSDYDTGDERLQRSDWRKQNYKTFGKLGDLKLSE